jgi:histidine ammonia-lyase
MLGIGSQSLGLKGFYDVLFGKKSIALEGKALKKVEESFRFLEKFSKGKVIYGVNTGFGPMAQYKIREKDSRELQYNLIRSHSSGCGQRLPGVYVKAVMLARLNTLMKGFSGIHPETVQLLQDMINAGIYPCIFEHGSVGASGDLVQLAHVALAMIGEGDVEYSGKVMPAATALKKAKLKPLQMHIREGLALMNGTSCMAGIGMINLLYARNLLSWSVMASAMINEIVASFDDHFSTELNQTKLHHGQQHIAQQLQQILIDSKLVRRRPEHLYNKQIEAEVMHDKVQEYYSLRCVPQILGPVHDTIVNSEMVLVNEVNSANDNPIIDAGNNNVFHGGNFHGDYVAFEMDKLKMAVTKLSMLAERQLNFLLNDKLNNILPPFINLGKLGFNFGLQGMQFTATSTVAENQTLAYPMYLHSIPNNNDNQDIVSMGSNAALITKKVIDSSFQVLAIEMMAVLQAVDYLKAENKLATHSKRVYQALRKVSPAFANDLPKYREIALMTQFLTDNEPGKI